ncbi:MAG: winged helix-turn-helix transcriptional regulator, partial [Bacteroidota bacterium]
MRKASNSKDLKISNRLLVRDIIRRKGLIARYELAKETGLTPPTVTVIVNELVRDGVVREVGRGESHGGRRPVMLELNPIAALIFAVRIQRGEAVTAIFDLIGNILNQHSQTVNTTSPEELIEVIGESYDWLVQNTELDKKLVLWCGIATPGLVDTSRGVVERSSNLGWEKVP